MRASLAAPTSLQVPEFQAIYPALPALRATAESGIDLHHESLVHLIIKIYDITCTRILNFVLDGFVMLLAAF